MRKEWRYCIRLGRWDRDEGLMCCILDMVWGRISDDRVLAISDVGDGPIEELSWTAHKNGYMYMFNFNPIDKE